MGDRLRAASLMAGLMAAGPAVAQTPRPWQMGFQPAHSPVMQGIEGLHSLIMWIIAAISVFVLCLLLWVAYRYRSSRNPVPSRVSHHTALEIAWTLIPVLILVVIAIPSFRLVYFEDRTSDPAMTLKVTGHQWNWQVEYPDNGGFSFISNMVPDDEIKAGQLRRLSVDNQIVLPAGQNIRILTTSGDVIHSFYIPSLGVQRYAIPGRTIETWVKIDQPGDYYGECNQICGTNHSAMPISIHAVTPDEFTKWAAEAKTKFASGEQHLAIAEIQH